MRKTARRIGAVDSLILLDAEESAIRNRRYALSASLNALVRLSIDVRAYDTYERCLGAIDKIGKEYIDEIEEEEGKERR